MLDLIKMLAVFAILSVIITACGQSANVDQPFIPYVDSFKGLLSAHGMGSEVNVAISFGEANNSGGDTVAQCNGAGGLTQPRIVVNETAWNGLSDDARKIVLYHELGHCVLGLKHNTNLITDISGNSRPESIMFPQAERVVPYYGTSQAAYDDQLFQNVTQRSNLGALN